MKYSRFCTKSRHYWSDRDGNPPPLDARFGYRPFFSNALSPFSAEAVVKLPDPMTVPVLSRRYLPAKDEWIQMVEKALRAGIEKVVLARCQILELAFKPDPFALLASLNGQGAYRFCVEEPEWAFFGASPERLFYRCRDKLWSEAMAGTRKRGKTDQEDARLREDLMHSVKDLSELTPVKRFLQEALTPLSQLPPQFSPVEVHRTTNVQHLYSQCNTVLRKNITDQMLLNSIHPTPALCGMPQRAASQLIKELEPFDRGLYGGAIGWSSADSSEWIVAIRSCLLKGTTAYLYAGTGIVKGSDPEKEWEELNHKEALYANCFLDH